MENLQNASLSDVMQGFSKASPIVIVVCAVFSFLAVGIFSVDYYEELFKVRFSDNAYAMAVLVAAIQEAVRFALLISSIRDFSDKKALNGWLGLVASGFLVWHDMKLATDVALTWDAANAAAYEGIFYFLILLGLILEIRLILTVGSAPTKSVVAEFSNTNYNAESSVITKRKKHLNGTV